MAVPMRAPFGAQTRCSSRPVRHRAVRVCAAAVQQQPPRSWKLAAAVCQIWQSHQTQQATTAQEGQQESQASLIQQLKSQCSCMAAVLPFASTTVIKASSSGQAEIYYGLAKAVDIYLVVLTVRILLSWFRTIDWYAEPWNTLRQLTDPFLQLFRGIIPPIGGIDLSPMLGFFLLNFGRNMLMQWAM